MVPNVLLDVWTGLIWRACWQGSLVVLVVWLICRLLPSMPARFQCWFWRLAILKFMIVLLLPSLINLPLLPAPAIATPEISSRPLPAVVLAERQRIVAWDSKFSSPKAIETPSLRGILCLGWMIGVGWSVVRLFGDWRKSKRLRRRCKILRHAPTIDLLAAQLQLFGLRRPSRLLEAAGSGSPMLVGIFRPAIVVPAATLRRLSNSELTLALGHELAHIRRGDLRWELLAAMVRAVLFFHPLVWWSSRQLRLVQEAAADELVIARQRHDAIGYGRLLVSLVGKLGVRPLVSALSLETAGPVHSLKWRLLVMTNIGRTSRRVVIFSGLLLGAAVLLGLLPWRLVAAEPKKPDQTPLQGEKESFRNIPLARNSASQSGVASASAAVSTDNSSPTVSMKVSILEVNLTKLRRLGIDFKSLNCSTDEAARLSGLAEKKQPVPQSANLVPAKATSSPNYVELKADDPFFSVLNALKEDNLVSVIANSNVTAQSGQPANFFAGGEISVPAPQADGKMGEKRLQHGIRVDILPTVLDRETINLRMNAEVSVLDYSKSVTFAGKKIPTIKKLACGCSACTLKDGHAVLIAQQSSKRPIAPSLASEKAIGTGGRLGPTK